MSLLEDLKKYGDRSSSFMTLYPGFKSFYPKQLDDGVDQIEGQIRFMETNSAWIAGTEPIAPSASKASLFKIFEREARKKNKNSIIAPVTEKFSEELLSLGYHRVQIGVEAVFYLSDFFKKDPLLRFPHARALEKKGAAVRLLSPEEVRQRYHNKFDRLIEKWFDGRTSGPLGFLNQVNPLYLAEQKKIFVLECGDEVMAFLSAVPVYARNGYFFADYIRAENSKAGTVELLFIQAMRLLHQMDYAEVRLGTSPFAQLNRSFPRNIQEKTALRFMSFLFEKCRFPMNFKSIYEFKAKFRPTRWEPLYLVSRKPIGFRTLFDIARVHFSRPLFWVGMEAVFRKLKAYRKPQVVVRSAPTSWYDLISRTKITLFFLLAFTALHVWRYLSVDGNSFFSRNGFSPSDYSVLGHLFGPLFHNNHFHFFGDLSTFFLFGAAVEILLGARFSFVVIAVGLWASNPQAVAIVKLVEPLLPIAAHARFMTEIDYGSSNAVYAMVGALSALLAKPFLLLFPFVLNGLFLCFAMQSILSIHHLTALASGFLLCSAFQLLQKKLPISNRAQSSAE